jgi:hypothetical protein
VEEANNAARGLGSSCPTTLFFTKLKSDISIIFCRTVHTLACALGIHHPTTVDQANTNNLISLVFGKKLDELVLDFAEIDLAQAFFNLIKTANYILTKAHEHESLLVDPQHAIEATQDSFNNLLDDLFACSWNTYLGIKAELQHQLELQEFVMFLHNFSLIFLF